mmetsp:Transcript_38061/g.52850  ORF Transcript_38061/g.52850 Transcript_38061/m.52850 type:complete len:140 (-) Transcript_38061:47-466(-)
MNVGKNHRISGHILLVFYISSSSPISVVSITSIVFITSIVNPSLPAICTTPIVSARLITSHWHCNSSWWLTITPAPSATTTSSVSSTTTPIINISNIAASGVNALTTHVTLPATLLFRTVSRLVPFSTAVETSSASGFA